MAAKKNVENVNETQETVVEEPTVEVVDETIVDEAQTEEETKSETVEKKDNFVVRWAKKEKENFKAAPVKYVAKKAVKVVELGLAIVGTKTIYNSVKGSDVIEETVDLLPELTQDVAEDVIE